MVIGELGKIQPLRYKGTKKNQPGKRIRDWRLEIRGRKVKNTNEKCKTTVQN